MTGYKYWIVVVVLDLPIRIVWIISNNTFPEPGAVEALRGPDLRLPRLHHQQRLLRGQGHHNLNLNCIWNKYSNFKALTTLNYWKVLRTWNSNIEVVYILVTVKGEWEFRFGLKTFTFLILILTFRIDILDICIVWCEVLPDSQTIVE